MTQVLRISIGLSGSHACANSANPSTDFINYVHGVRLTFTNTEPPPAVGLHVHAGLVQEPRVVRAARSLGPNGTLNIGTIASPFLLTAAQIDANLETPPNEG